MDEMQQKRLEFHFKHLFEHVKARAGMGPYIAALSATLLIVATFNSELIALTAYVRLLITLLLALIPTSLFFYLYEVNEAINRTREAIEEETGQAWFRSGNHTLRFGAIFPWVALIVVSFVTVSIICLIWR